MFLVEINRGLRIFRNRSGAVVLGNQGQFTLSGMQFRHRDCVDSLREPEGRDLAMKQLPCKASHSRGHISVSAAHAERIQFLNPHTHCWGPRCLLLPRRWLSIRMSCASVRTGMISWYMTGSPPPRLRWCMLCSCGVPGSDRYWSGSTGPSSTLPMMLGPPPAGTWPKSWWYSTCICGSPFYSSCPAPAKSGCRRWKS